MDKRIETALTQVTTVTAVKAGGELCRGIMRWYGWTEDAEWTEVHCGEPADWIIRTEVTRTGAPRRLHSRPYCKKHLPKSHRWAGLRLASTAVEEHS